MVRDIHCVHANTDERIYTRAAEGEIVLFYATKPHPKEYISPDRFPGEYLVPADKAYDLRDLILKGTSAEDIVNKLDLERADIRNFLGETGSGENLNSLASYRKTNDDSNPVFPTIESIYQYAEEADFRLKTKLPRLVRRGIEGLGAEWDD